ncbi:MAG: mandelate racemase/muconate lactonizing enzyme family protein [Planctomycetaceae bacterium]|jgi:L-alanine-DL-glutamate epimerase-like enolase superfamily enzyme|nr:mandelate racemase/muconate lactonizing enzyme family protein [Planctomycetaceae bacterium]
MKATDICIAETESKTAYFPYRSPAKFGGRVVNDVMLLDVSVRVRTRNGKEATGHGSMSMGNIWAWPSKTMTTDQTLQAMVEFGHKVAAGAKNPGEFGHPLELIHNYSKEYQRLADETTQSQKADPMVKLAQLVAASPFEAALFDAYGRVLGANVYQLLSKEYCNCDLSHFLNKEFAGEYLDQYIEKKPKERMPLYHLVGALDPLDKSDVEKPLNDGLPEDLAEWIMYNGLTHLKIKLNGDDLDWDVNRVLRVDRIAEEVQSRRGIKQWFYSADFNEKCENVEYVLNFLNRIKEKQPKAIDRLQYIEQPTNRNLRQYPENKMHKAAAVKPVVIDEALVDFDSLLYCREMGYSGVALKACKGHAEALLMGAAAQKYKMFLCVQDLTCPGASFLHSASLSAWIPGVQAIEGNGRQYCPAANKGWEDLYPGMFKVTDGTLNSGIFTEPGLGFHWI